jgi:hypothetical protein
LGKYRELIDVRYERPWAGLEGVTYVEQDLETGELFPRFEIEPELRVRGDWHLMEKECWAWGRLSEEWLLKAQPDDVRKLARVYNACGDFFGIERIMTLRPDVKL